MKQIYNFEVKDPPETNEEILRAEIARRNIRRQTALTAAAGILIQICIVLLSFIAYEISPIITVIGCIYTAISLIGSRIVFNVFRKKVM